MVSLETRFDTTYYEKFLGFLFDLKKFKSTNNNSLMGFCANLKAYLKDGVRFGIEGCLWSSFLLLKMFMFVNMFYQKK